MSTKLKPCPFCGGKASSDGKANYYNSDRSLKNQNAWWDDGTPVDEAYFCNCPKCGVSNKGIIGYRTVAEAIEQWNIRTKPKIIKDEDWIMLQGMFGGGTAYALIMIINDVSNTSTTISGHIFVGTMFFLSGMIIHFRDHIRRKLRKVIKVKQDR